MRSLWRKDLFKVCHRSGRKFRPFAVLQATHLALKAVHFGLGLIWRRTVQARFVKRYDAVPLINHGGITPPQHRPDYCAQKKNGRPENKRSLRNQTNLTQDILDELLKHEPC